MTFRRILAIALIYLLAAGGGADLGTSTIVRLVQFRSLHIQLCLRLL